MSSVLPIVLAVITGGGFTAAVNAIVGRRRVKAEAGKIDADAAKTIADAATALVAPLSAQVGAMGERLAVAEKRVGDAEGRVDAAEQRVGVLERENAHKTTLLDSAIRLIRDWLHWDSDGRIGNPPVVPADLRAEVER